MKTKSLKTLPPEILNLVSQFENFRKENKKGTRFPKELWDQAIFLSRKHGPSRISNFLKINYNALKQHLGPEINFTKNNKSFPFVEVKQGSVVNQFGTTVELKNPLGESIKILFPPGCSDDLFKFTQHFLNRTP